MTLFLQYMKMNNFTYESISFKKYTKCIKWVKKEHKKIRNIEKPVHDLRDSELHKVKNDEWWWNVIYVFFAIHVDADDNNDYDGASAFYNAC